MMTIAVIAVFLYLLLGIRRNTLMTETEREERYARRIEHDRKFREVVPTVTVLSAIFLSIILIAWSYSW